MNLPLRLAQGVVNAAWRAVARRPAREESKQLSPLLHPVAPGTGGWFGLIREPFTGAWQQNVEVRTDHVLTFNAIFRCISLISSDIAKPRIKLVEEDANGIWTETTSPSFSPVLRKPNLYQNRIQFIVAWMISKLIHGNAYVLKERDQRRVVTRLHVLNPTLVTVLVAPDGAVYYELRQDHLGGVMPNDRDRLVVPASEIIHDRYESTFAHPLIGLSPIHACGLAAVQGLKIQSNSTHFFANGSNPGGVLTAPGKISNETAARIKEYWDRNYGAGGAEVGRVAVLGDGLKYDQMTMSATDAQLVEQLKITAETVASAFGVPAYKIGVGPPPAYNNIEALDQAYYSQCLQIHIESIELCLDEGLGLGPAFGNSYGTEFELDTLLRMDTATKVKSTADAIGAGFLSPNEARWKFDLPPVEGGDSPYLQQQNFSLWALNKRDQQGPPVTPGLSAPANEPQSADEDTAQSAKNAIASDEKTAYAASRALAAELFSDDDETVQRLWDREAAVRLQ